MDTHRLGSALWFGPKNQPLRGWLHKPTNDDALTSRRIVIVPGFGYEELTSGWGLRTLAENLAEAGHTVLRYDHPGTGDSSGDAPNLQAWFEGVHHAVQALNSSDVTLVGVRLGATLALAAAANFAEARQHLDRKTITQQPANTTAADNAIAAPLCDKNDKNDKNDKSIGHGEGSLALLDLVEDKIQLRDPNRLDQKTHSTYGNGAITQIVAISPVVSGRRMMRELTVLAAARKAVAPVPVVDYEQWPLQLTWAATTSPTPTNQPALVVGGFEYPEDLRIDLGNLDLLSLTASPAPRVEIVHAAERSTDKSLATHLRSKGTAVYESSVEGIGKWLDASSEVAIAPQSLIALVQDQLHGYAMSESTAESTTESTTESIADFTTESTPEFISAFGRGTSNEPTPPITQTSTFQSYDSIVREHSFFLGEPSLCATTTEPIEPSSKKAVAVLLLNSGVERSVGPGRAWVTWSRSLAAMGHTVLRLDLSGVGNSGTWPNKPAFHNYGPETFDDVALGIEKLRAMGHEKIVLAGLCASAFSAIGTTVLPSVVGIVSMSPQFYRCGTPASVAEVEDTNLNRHRISQLDQKLNLRRKGAVIEEMVGKRHLSMTWIEAWLAQGTQIRLVFGPDDRGLRFLQWRAPRALKRLTKNPKFALQIHPELDHAMHNCAARADVFRDLCELLNSV